MSGGYKRDRWIVYSLASIFLLVMEVRALNAMSMAGQIFWHVLLYGGMLVFTLLVFRRLEQMQARVNEQSASFRALFEATGLGIFMVGPNCIITEANRSAEQLSGWTRAELIGRRACAELLFHPESGSLGCPGLCSPVGPDASRNTEALTALRLRHKSGAEIPVMTSVAQLGGGARSQSFAYLMWDVSERTRLEAEAAVRRRQAEGLREIGLEVAALSDLKQGMEAILHRARELFGMDLMAWGILDETAKTVSWQAASGAGSDRFFGAGLPVDGTAMGRILAAGRPFVTHNLAGQLGAEPQANRLFGDPGLRTAMAVPLRVRDTWYGVLLCASISTLKLTDEDVMLFTHLGTYLATAVENEELLGQVHHMAALEERQRLARELHDGFGQILTYLGVRNLMISRLARDGNTAEIQAETDRLKQILQEAHADVRRSIYHLKDSGTPRAPLVERWRELLKGFEERSGIGVLYEIGGKVPLRLAGQAELQLTRILQEALANVRNHSGARSVTVRLKAAEESLHLTISDDGCGFGEGVVPGANQHHFGLSIMRERAAAVGGQLEVQSALGHGTKVELRVPLRGKEECG